MQQMLITLIPWLACCGIAGALIYGAERDYKLRIIPNSVPIVILACGCFTSVPLVSKLISLGIMVGILFLCTAIMKQTSGGGDIKLYCALSFALGLQSFAIVLVGTLVLCMIWKRLKHMKRGERVPLCTFMAPAYGFYLSMALIAHFIF